PRREGRLRAARATGPGRPAPCAAGASVALLYGSRSAHHAGRNRLEGTAEGIAPAGGQPGHDEGRDDPQRAVRGPARHGGRCDPGCRCAGAGVAEDEVGGPLDAWQHLRTILVLPGTAAVVVPALFIFLTGPDPFRVDLDGGRVHGRLRAVPGVDT